MSTNLPTAHPPSKCVEKWSQWINRDKQPDGREREYMNSTEKNSFCVGGRVSGIECKTIDNIASYSSGEILECSMENGLICEDAVNAPMPCSDYQVRYYCKCPVACREKMGMESGHILTNMITVSSSRDGNLNPSSSRLNSHGAWTPNHNDQKQYIQYPDDFLKPILLDDHENSVSVVRYVLVNFLKPMLLTGIITQGRENNGSYVTSYKVLFSKDGFTWSPYQDFGQDKNFTGNNNSGSKATNWFDHPIRAQYIRVVPLTWQGVIAMRMEVLGCYEGYPTNSCIYWDVWVNEGHLTLTSGGDSEPISALQSLSKKCPTPVMIECVRASDGLPYDQEGQNVKCDLWNGLQCFNADNPPLCYDYKARLGCLKNTTECFHGSTTSLQGQVTTGAPVQCSGNWSSWINTDTPDNGDGDREIKYYCECTVHGSTTSLQGQVTTGGSVQCSGKWSSWINMDTPDNGDGDRESWTAAQKAAFCPYGKISRIECRTTDDIASYSTGEIMQCSIEGGAVCSNDDNFPVPCSEYKIKYYCECTVHGSTTSLQGQVTTGGSVQCSGKWSSWINMDTPDNGDGDRESWTAAQKAAFCPYGKISRIECRTTDDIASYSTGEIMQCSIEGGAVCLNDDNFPVPCSDYKIKYYRECTGSPTLHPAGVSGGVPTVTPPSGKTQNPNLVPPTVHHDHTTHTHGGPSIAPCLTRWSRWINRDHPDSGRDDIEKMNVFCREGRIKGIECVTVDGIASYSSGEILSCSINNGLECLNDNNFPVPCSDYKIRYHCDCVVSPLSVTSKPPVQANHITPVPVTKGPCIPEQCPPMVKPVSKEGEELQTVIDENGCCSKNIVVCKPNLCAPPILNCPAPMSLEQAGGESDCCVTYRCMCPAICPTTTKPVCKQGKEAVEIQTKCNWTSFACMTRMLVLPTPGQNTCQYKLADNTTQTYQTGQTWSDGFCTHCACIAKEGVAGIGYKTIARPDQCCGDCQPNGCVVNGTIYKDGATIPTSRKCYDKTCTFDAEIGMFIVSETHVQCPAYEQLTECKANEEAYDATGCCMKCLPERNVTSSSLTCQTCAPRLVFAKDVEPIPDLLECSGFCNSRSFYSHVMQGLTIRCNCCQATGSETRNVQLTCKSGRKITKSYSVPKSCGYNACSGEK
ncbi:EDIL3-like protein [Mya arenaria]|uniref:EDIL3-like protein n=1 Tax=Mya arenaria TaxID=6604 RepID=A0ABY7D6Z4_MYAAR|nr:EDIL3-like protein [Mya arenaria]